MPRKFMLFSRVSLFLIVVFGGIRIANGQVEQVLGVCVKKDPVGGFSNADLNGRYWLRKLRFRNFETINREAYIDYGYVDYHGDGTWDGFINNFESDGSTGTDIVSGTYEVHADGSVEFRVLFSDAPLPPELVTTSIGHIGINRSFGISSDGQVKGENIEQGITLTIKEPDSPLTLSDFNGTWQFRDLEIHSFEQSYREVINFVGTFICNNGNCDVTVNGMVSDGTMDTFTGPMPYLINGNAFDFPHENNEVFSVYLSKDGNTSIFSKGDDPVNISQWIGVAVKKATKTFTNADLSGTYFFHTMRINDFETENRTAEIIRGSVIFDGVGNWTFTGDVFYSNGNSFTGGSGFGTYSVNPDGSFTLIDTSDTPGTSYGNISSDNNVVIVNPVQQAIITSPPDKPNLLSPSNGSSGVSLTPTLKTDSFSDPDSGDTHQQTEWQISTMSDYSFNLIHLTSTVHLTSLIVPELTLNEGTTYYWRVRFYDSNLSASPWSDVYSFTTLTTTNDQDGNGIPDSQENDTIDLDSDGTQDIQQDDIKSLNTVIGGGQMGVSRKGSPNVTSIQSIESIDPQTISETARPSIMPLGLFAFNLKVANAGDAVQVTVYFSEAAPDNAKWLIYDSINQWQDYSNHATFSVDRKSVVLDLKDGDYGDADGLANGVIVDPGGFGLASWIEGYIRDASTGQAITTAEISIGGLVLKSMLDGHYLSMILPGTYSCNVAAEGYQTIYLMTQVSEGDTASYDFSMTSDVSGNGWVTIQGSVTYNGTPLCAMVLANGQYMFSCDPNGEYQLSVPLDANGEITLFVFVDGLAPFKITSAPSSLPSNIAMQLASPDSKMSTVTKTVTGSTNTSGWVKIAGTVSLDGTPLCAMVLANGEYMFSCDPNGEYGLEVPLDGNGQVTLFVFVDGLQPYKEIFLP